MELLEYKKDANSAGNLIVPTWVNNTDCDHFYKESNFTYVGLRLSMQVKVPDSVTKLTKATLLERVMEPGLMLKPNPDYVPGGEEPSMIQMTEEEIGTAIDEFCLARGIE